GGMLERVLRSEQRPVDVARIGGSEQIVGGARRIAADTAQLPKPCQPILPVLDIRRHLIERRVESTRKERAVLGAGAMTVQVADLAQRHGIPSEPDSRPLQSLAHPRVSVIMK